MKQEAVALIAGKTMAFISRTLVFHCLSSLDDNGGEIEGMPNQPLIVAPLPSFVNTNLAMGLPFGKEIPKQKKIRKFLRIKLDRLHELLI